MWLIKSAVETPDMKEDLPEFPDSEEEVQMPKKNPKLIELEEWKPSIPPAQTSQTQMSMPRATPKMQRPMPALVQQKRSEENRPVFIKLDKFKDARESLASITEKVDHLEELLKMIRDVKTRETAEIEHWEQEIEKIKSQVTSVNSELFENATR